jgi:hypothetical protein
MSKKDDEAAAYYEDPAHRDSDGPGYPLPGRSARLSTYVPVRFDRETVAQIRQFSDEDGMTVSAWVRRVVDREIRRRVNLRPRSLTARKAPVAARHDQRAAETVTASSGATFVMMRV